MYLLITDKHKKDFIIKKSDIRRVYKDANNNTVILFTGAKNTPIQVNESVEDFFNIFIGK